MDDKESNDSKKESKVEKTDKEDEKKDDEDNPEKMIKSFNTKDINFKFNIYKKGKRLSKQLVKLKNNFSNFLYYLSTDSPSNNQTINTKTRNNLKIQKNDLKLNTLNNLPSLSTDKTKRSKNLSLTIPKTKNESKMNQSKKENKKCLFKSVQFRTTNLNKLYGYNKNFYSFKDSLKKNKLIELEKYQEDILRLSSMNLSRDNLLKLYSDLKNLRKITEEVKPLPPINFKSLIIHSLSKKKKIKIEGFLPKKKKFKDMDEYEKELYKIKTNLNHEKIKVNNKTLYKMYEILPEHVVEKLYIKKRKF